jgi:hypothetical protein
VVASGLRDDRLASAERSRDDPARDLTADLIDLFLRETLRGPPAGSRVVARDLEVALVRAGDLAQQVHDLAQQRLEVGEATEREEPAVEIALATELLDIGLRSVFE